LRKIEEIVAGLLNEVDLPEGRHPNIVVRTDEDFASTNQVAHADGERIWSLLSERGQPLLLALGALVVVVAWLVFSRNKKKNNHESEAASESGLPLITARKSGDESIETDFASGSDPLTNDPSDDLKDQLSQLVQKDPDAAVDALRKWIRKVA
jgi:flagellar biosynthesis/type III secretory pathway M-ring protein FliF/YscJ